MKNIIRLKGGHTKEYAEKKVKELGLTGAKAKKIVWLITKKTKK